MSAVCTVKGAVQLKVQYSQGCSTVKGAVQSRVQCSQGCSAVKGAVQSRVQCSQWCSTVKGAVQLRVLIGPFVLCLVLFCPSSSILYSSVVCTIHEMVHHTYLGDLSGGQQLVGEGPQPPQVHGPGGGHVKDGV